VRIVSTLLLIVGLAGCAHHAAESNDAVRQGVLDYLAAKGMTPAAMDITVTAVKFDGDKAEATVAFAVKGTGAAQMAIPYLMERKGGKWAVVGRKNASEHGGGQLPPGAAPQGAMPGTDNPHGGAMPSPGAGGPAGGKMPAPEDLPPAGKKK
jgi:hypothetical protein